MSQRIKTKRSEIANYWHNKVIHKKTFKVHEYDEIEQKSAVEDIIIDIGEPCCWACGCYVLDKNSKNKSLDQKWDTHPTTSLLERCHIKPAHLGGEDKPSNLFLLCNHCHHESPDTLNPDNFFAWVLHKRYNHAQEELELIQKAARIKGYDLMELEQKIENHSKEYYIILHELNIKALHKCGIHGRNVSKMSHYMNYIDELVDYIKLNNL